MTAPEQAGYVDFLNTWLPTDADKMVDVAGVPDINDRVYACYYDPLEAMIRFKQSGLISGALADHVSTSFRTTYNAYLVANSYNPSIPFLYSSGFALDWEVNGNATSRAAIALLTTNSGYTFVGADQSKFNDIHYAREVAFTLQVYINNHRVGNVGSLDSRALGLKNNCITLINNWTNGVATYTQFYIRPFMTWIVTQALILWDNQYGLTTLEKNTLNTFFTWLKATQWRGTDPHPSFNFTSVRLDNMDPNVPPTSEQAGLVAQNQDPENQVAESPDVSLMGCGVYAWLYKQGYGTVHRDTADALFINGFPHYLPGYAGEGGLYKDYGAYVGTNGPLGINAKHVNQQVFHIPEYLEFRETVVVTVPAGRSFRSKISPGTGIFSKYPGYFGKRQVPDVVVYNPPSYFTGGTIHWTAPADTTKVLNAGGTSAAEGVKIQTMNPSSGSATFFQATVGSQPINRTGISHGQQAAEFPVGAAYMDVTGFSSALNLATNVRMWAIFKLLGIGGNAGFFRAYDNTYSFNRLRFFLSSAAPSAEVSRTDGTASSIFTGNGVTDALTVGSIHLVEMQYDVVAGTIAIQRNTVACTLTASGTPLTAGASYPNTTLNEPRVGTGADIQLLDWGMAVSAAQTGGQLAAFRAAAKTTFDLTGY